MQVGKVFLVGAGPGDPGLMTVRGLDVLRQAEIVVYDRLVNPVLLEQAPSAATRIFVGKGDGKHHLPQEEINEIMIGYARSGCRVVRLKGGDPFVFGRGGEEAQALVDAEVSFEVVPGVSSAVAVPAYVGIPLTHRQLSSSFAVITGHEACKTRSSVDWAKLATAVDTLVILMGLKNLPAIVDQLLANGRSPETPVALIRWGTTQEQEVVTGTLTDILKKAKSMYPPVVIVVGAVVNLANPLHWFENHCRTIGPEESFDGDESRSQPSRA
jgi:uroporphyrinogen III methyltransferase/synthase